MKRTSMLFCALLVSAAAVAGAHKSFTMQVTIKSTAAEQIAMARSSIAAARKAPTEDERIAGLLKAVAELDAVSRVWPTDRVASINAAVLKSQAFEQSGSPKDAIRSLEEILPLADDGNGGAVVHCALGKLFLRRGNGLQAESEFLKAERAARADKDDDTAFAANLQLADYYSRLGNAKDAAKRFRDLSADKKLDETSRVHFLMRSARERVRLGQDAELKNDLDAAEKILDGERGKAGRSPDQVRIQDAFREEIAFLRNAHKL
jgi:tetratricopeptide (TPR) repeat protein